MVNCIKNIKKTIVIISFLQSINIFSQTKIDDEYIMKMHLFNNIHIGYSDDKDSSSVVKNIELFNAFSKVISLKIDTLEVSDNLGYYYPRFRFLKLRLYDKKNKLEITHLKVNRLLNNDEQQFFMVNGAEYIIAINEESGINYRIKGFDNNDFIDFWANYKNEYRERNKNLSFRRFLKKYKVKGLDFECLYKGYKSKNRQKYPCFESANDIIDVH